MEPAFFVAEDNPGKLAQDRCIEIEEGLPHGIDLRRTRTWIGVDAADRPLSDRVLRFLRAAGCERDKKEHGNQAHAAEHA